MWSDAVNDRVKGLLPQHSVYETLPNAVGGIGETLRDRFDYRALSEAVADDLSALRRQLDARGQLAFLHARGGRGGPAQELGAKGFMGTPDMGEAGKGREERG